MKIHTAIEKGYLTSEMQELILHECPYCGTELEVDESLIHYYCTNELCSRLLANRLEKMFKVLKVDGFGPQVCMDIVESNELKYLHQIFEIDPFMLTTIYSEDRNLELYDNLFNAREQTLSTIVKSMGLPSIQTSADKIFSGYSDLREFYNDFVDDPEDFIAYKLAMSKGIMTEKIANTLMENFEQIINFVKYFIIKKVADESLEIAITGSVNGYKSKEGFIDYLNSMFGDKVAVSMKSSVTRDTSFLLSESPSNSSKFKKAQDYGIPIVTSEELIKRLEEM